MTLPLRSPPISIELFAVHVKFGLVETASPQVATRIGVCLDLRLRANVRPEQGLHKGMRDFRAILP